MIPWYLLSVREYVYERRLGRSLTEISKLGIAPEVFYGERVLAERNSGCTRGHRSILEKAFWSGLDQVGVFEDDIFVFDAPRVLDQIARAEEDPDWDILLLGIHPPHRKLEYVMEEPNDHFFRVKNCWGTHAVIYRKSVIPFLLSVIGVDGLAGQEYNIDTIMISHCYGGRFRAYLPKTLGLSFYGGKSFRQAGSDWGAGDLKDKTFEYMRRITQEWRMRHAGSL